MDTTTLLRPGLWSPDARAHLRESWRSVRWAFGLWMLGLLVFLTGTMRLNVMHSLPYGLYRLTHVSAALTYGDVVVVRTPVTVQLLAHLHGWPWGLISLMKPVAAVAGDTICATRLYDIRTTEARLVINGVDWGAIYATSPEGRSLPNWIRPGECRTLAADEVFLASAVDGSLDSRYLGPIDRRLVTTQAVPWWTWEPYATHP